MAGKSAESEFDFIIKARQEARKVVDYYKTYLEDAGKVDIPFIELESKKELRKIAALDGGERKKSLIASSVIVVRAGGGIFEKDKKIRKKVMHDIFITSIYQDIDRFANLIRDILEFRISLELLEEDPEVLIMDGSLVGYVTRGVPNNVIGHLHDRTIRQKAIQEYVEAYKEYLRLFDRLLKTCYKKKILLMGVSKDSHVHYLINEYHLNTAITDYALLQLKMRRPCATEPMEVMYSFHSQPIQEFVDEKNYLQPDIASFYISYFKLKKNSIPIRVDFPKWQRGRFKEVMSIMETYHDQKGFLLTAHLVHNWAVMKESILTSAVNAIREEVLKLEPSIYNAIFAPQRREAI